MGGWKEWWTNECLKTWIPLCSPFQDCWSCRTAGRMGGLLIMLIRPIIHELSTVQNLNDDFTEYITCSSQTFADCSNDEDVDVMTTTMMTTAVMMMMMTTAVMMMTTAVMMMMMMMTTSTMTAVMMTHLRRQFWSSGWWVLRASSGFPCSAPPTTSRVPSPCWS